MATTHIGACWVVRVKRHKELDSVCLDRELMDRTVARYSPIYPKGAVTVERMVARSSRPDVAAPLREYHNA